MSQAEKKLIPEGYKQMGLGLIPEDWEVVTLDDAANFLDGQRRPVKSGDRARIKGQYPYYGASGIVDYVNDYIFDGEFILLGEDGENILSRNLPLAFKASGKIWVNNHAHVMTPKANFQIDFLTSYLESLDYSLLNSGTAQPKLNKQSCLNIKVIKPLYEEQAAIANALSDVDALLSELENLIAKKQAIKTATMQQLLTGKTRLPQFAFYSDINSTEGAIEGKRNNASATIVNAGASDDGSLASQESGGMVSRRKGTKTSELGEIPEDWEVVTIDDALSKKMIIDQMDGNHGELYPKSHEFKEDGVPYVGATDFYNGVIDYRNCKKLPLDRAKKFKKGIAVSGDILFAHNATVGPTTIVETEEDFIIISTTATYYRCDNNKIKNTYLLSFFKSDLFVKQFSAVMSQSTRNQVPILAQRKFLIVLPNIAEQTAIATILSDMDNEIQTLEQRLSKTRQIKQGMMQELLTGKTRLPFTSVQEVK